MPAIRHDPTLNPAEQKLKEAVTELTEKTGVNLATITTVSAKFIRMIAGRFDHICDVAMAEENEGCVSVGFRVTFDMTRKTPVGKVTLAFVQRTQDEAEFQVPDPEQATLAFGGSPSASPAREESPPRRSRPTPRRTAE